ncbi:MAG: protein sorting system archaetidylserine synthase [Halobacteriaceae archaeon]
MRPRFAGRLSAADAVTAANAALGFCAVAAMVGEGAVALGARLVLLAAIADGLDGVVARWRGGSALGDHLDSLADVASFGVAPAALAYAAWYATDPTALDTVLAYGVPAAFVAVAVVRLALYTELDAGEDCTRGAPTTLAGTLLAAGVLSGVPAWAVLAAAGAFTYLMVMPVTYPDLLDRDALAMGVLQSGAVLAPTVASRAFPRALLAAGLAYLVLAPRFYWR